MISSPAAALLQFAIVLGTAFWVLGPIWLTATHRIGKWAGLSYAEQEVGEYLTGNMMLACIGLGIVVTYASWRAIQELFAAKASLLSLVITSTSLVYCLLLVWGLGRRTARAATMNPHGPQFPGASGLAFPPGSAARRTVAVVLVMSSLLVLLLQYV